MSFASSPHHDLPDFCENIIFDAATIDKRLTELGAQITEEYKKLLQNGEELVLVSVLKGSYMFAADLCRKMTVVPSIMEFLAVSSYGNATTSSGEGT